MTSHDARYDDPSVTDLDQRDDFDTKSDTETLDGEPVLPVDAEPSDQRSDDDLAVDDKADSDVADADLTDSEQSVDDRADSDLTGSDLADSDPAVDDKADLTGSDLADSDLAVDDESDSDLAEPDRFDAEPTDSVPPTDAVSTDDSVPMDDEAATPAPVVDSTDSSDAVSPAGSTAKSDNDWHELQGRFVDDPEAAVREAGAWFEQAVADLRTRVETGSTEDLRTAFRRYRDLHSSLG
jgi:hypothetical protein